MPVIEENCPKCGGNIHAETFVGHAGNENAYTERICIGEKGIEGTDGASHTNRGTGCGFRAKKNWKHKRHDETVSTNDDWKTWAAAHLNE